MPEEFALDEPVRHCTAVLNEEGAHSARARPVDECGQQVFARTAFPLNQNRLQRVGSLHSRAKKILKYRVFSDQSSFLLSATRLPLSSQPQFDWFKRNNIFI